MVGEQLQSFVYSLGDTCRCYMLSNHIFVKFNTFVVEVC